MVEADALAGVALFAVLSAADRATLAGRLRRRRYTKDVVIFVRGEPGGGLYLVEHGRVRIVLTSADGKELAVDVFGPGDSFGELALLDGEPRSADAVAHEDCTLLFLPRADFDQALAARPAVARAVLTVLSQRVRRDTELLYEAVFGELPARLARAIRQLAPADQAAGEQVLHVTQEELAAMLGASRESINKWLGYFERQGLLRRQRGRLVLPTASALAWRRDGTVDGSGALLRDG